MLLPSVFLGLAMASVVVLSTVVVLCMLGLKVVHKLSAPHEYRATII